MRTAFFSVLLAIAGCNYGCDQCANAEFNAQGEQTNGGERMGATKCPPPAPAPVPPKPKPTPVPVPVVVTPPAPAPAPAAPSCFTACAQFRLKGCKEGTPTNDGATCEEVCETMQSSGFIVYDLSCASKIQLCSDISKCPRR